MGDLNAAREFLALIAERYPLPEGKRHALTIVDGHLTLILHTGGKDGDDWQMIGLNDPGDLDKSPQDLTNEICRVLADADAGSWPTTVPAGAG